MRAVVLLIILYCTVFGLAKVSSLRAVATDRWAVVVLQNGRAVRAEQIGVCWRLPFLEQFDFVEMTRSVVTLRNIRAFTGGGLRVDVDLAVTIACVDALKMYRQRPSLEDQAHQLIQAAARSTLADCRHVGLTTMPDVVADELRARCQNALQPLGLGMAHASMAAVRSPSAVFATLDALATATDRHTEMFRDAESLADVGRVRAEGRSDELLILDRAVRLSDPATVDLVRTSMLVESGAVAAVVVQPGAAAPTSAPMTNAAKNGHGFAIVIDGDRR